MSYIIGIDAGGTKTKGLILTDNKEILFEADAGYGNPNIDFEGAIANISEVLSICLSSPFGSQCHLVVVGVAGIEAGNNRERIHQSLKQAVNIPIILINDAVLAYHSIFELGDGVLTIAGTGSISYGRNEDAEKYAGGWGHLLGDEGSSYDVAIQACKQMIKEKEFGDHYSPLSLAFFKELNIHDAEQLKGFIYRATKGEIASLSYIVFLQAEEGNKEAKDIFERAGIDLANQTLRLIKNLKLTSPLSVGCKGSLLEKNKYVQEAFKSELNKYVESINFLESNNLPATGAYAAAKLYKPL
ncbi:BadF/BadG/BcrA/BcrD ATPase family protein [Heyndrickxia sp. NPDC080065]|uniref:BadF/BadG/BcrA/BcrD ATPase family protein n=1 Tax=Heyndrickxia sp. NPDC080065 TaxID=3390568 RepID=UPI003D03AB19